ncbi:MAG TPA: DUF2007 domain-containing protein [Solirubrobacterales bacterium]|nr:DUF2007 domain-containing protein [Solirubrobacterales bacterium]
MGDDLVEVAFVANEYEGAIVKALLEDRGIPSLEQRVGVDGARLGYSTLMGGGPQRVMVHAPRAEEARAILAEAAAEDLPEPVNARYLADAEGGRRVRGYGWAGAWARAMLVSIGTMALAFAIFLLLRVL